MLLLHCIFSNNTTNYIPAKKGECRMVGSMVLSLAQET